MKILIGGSPCTHWSIAKQGRETKPEGVGWELFKNFLIALQKFKPDYFLYENNKSMAQAIREQITAEFGVEPIMINSALVSAQNRQRLYWTNIPDVTQPEDRGILLKDIIGSGEAYTEAKGKAYALAAPIVVNPTSSGKSRTVDAHMAKLEGCVIPRMNDPNQNRQQYDCIAEPVNLVDGEKAHTLRANYYKDNIRNFVANTHDTGKTCVAEPVRIGTIESGTSDSNYDSKQYRVYSVMGKAVTLCGQGGGVGAKTGLHAVPVDGKSKAMPVYEVEGGYITIKEKKWSIKLADGLYVIRKLTVGECKRLQTVPDWYEFPVSNTQAYKMLGNGWTVDVISHILSFCPHIATEPLDVLSMYDGMSCGHIALDNLGANIRTYKATEIDKFAIKTTQHNFPDVVQLGDAFQVRQEGWEY